MRVLALLLCWFLDRSWRETIFNRWLKSIDQVLLCLGLEEGPYFSYAWASKYIWACLLISLDQLWQVSRSRKSVYSSRETLTSLVQS